VTQTRPASTGHGLDRLADQRLRSARRQSPSPLSFAVQPEDRPLLDELVAYFGNGNRSVYPRATLKTMRSVMLADQLRDLQSYGQQRTAGLGIEPGTSRRGCGSP
jgi:hypothetical protein